VPALLALNETLHADQAIRVLVYNKPFILQFLVMLGIAADRLVLYDPCTIYRADKVYFVNGEMIHATAAFADKMLDFVPPVPFTAPKPLILVIDRRCETWRKPLSRAMTRLLCVGVPATSTSSRKSRASRSRGRSRIMTRCGVTFHLLAVRSS
jgi:hypothetical protein